jgi:intracellular septation protein
MPEGNAVQEDKASMIDGPGAAPAVRRAINPTLKLVLELGPLGLFFVAWFTVGIKGATGVLMVAVVLTLGVSYALLRRLPTMPLVTAIIVLIFGSLTFYFNDPKFIMMKPTALYLLFGVALFGGLVFDRPLLPILFDGALKVTPEGWRKLTVRWALFFFALAALNEIVRIYQPDYWIYFKSFGFIPLTLLFAVAQAPLVMRYEAKDEEANETF